MRYAFFRTVRPGSPSGGLRLSVPSSTEAITERTAMSRVADAPSDAVKLIEIDQGQLSVYRGVLLALLQLRDCHVRPHHRPLDHPGSEGLRGCRRGSVPLRPQQPDERDGFERARRKERGGGLA